MSYLYLASPYTHPDAAVRLERYEQACKKAAGLMKKGHAVFSPIAHSHAVAAHLPLDLLMHHDFWMGQDIPILRWATRLVVLTIDGWASSKGVMAEIDYANNLRIPVAYEGVDE